MIMIYVVAAACLVAGYLAGCWSGVVHERDTLRDLADRKLIEDAVERHDVDRILGFWGEAPTEEAECDLVRSVYYERDPYPSGPAIAAFIVGLRQEGEST